MNSTIKIWHPKKSVILTKKIGEGTTIHAPVWIGRDVIIGRAVKIQAFVFIPDKVKISDNVFIGPCVCFTNDKHPPSGRENWQQTIIKKGASIGANATILCGITIGENALIGAGAVITKDVPANETWCGNPASKMK